MIAQELNGQQFHAMFEVNRDTPKPTFGEDVVAQMNPKDMPGTFRAEGPTLLSFEWTGHEAYKPAVVP